MSDDREESRRQASRRERRNAGDRSARVALELMKLKESSLDKLELDEELREVVDKARAIPSQVARRRAERALAGELRRIDIGELQKKLASIAATGVADTQLFHLAEQWRTRLLDEGLAAEQFPGGATEPLPTLMQNARRERETGKPPGAARALFRHVLTALRAQQAAAEDDGPDERKRTSGESDDEPDDEPDDDTDGDANDESDADTER